MKRRVFEAEETEIEYEKLYRFIYYKDERGYIHPLSVPVDATDEELAHLMKEYRVNPPILMERTVRCTFVEILNAKYVESSYRDWKKAIKDFKEQINEEGF